MLVHVYRNRSDDVRTRDDMHYCSACRGWYGVPHTNSHCQKGETARWKPDQCACRYCREYSRQPTQGTYGFFTEEEVWQPPVTGRASDHSLRSMDLWVQYRNNPEDVNAVRALRDHLNTYPGIDDDIVRIYDIWKLRADYIDASALYYNSDQHGTWRDVNRAAMNLSAALREDKP